VMPPASSFGADAAHALPQLLDFYGQ
jgi:hypothetical protein